MVHCAAINCTNSSSKRSDNTFSFFKLPKDPNRRKVWIAKSKRANLPKDENLHVCHEHFEENCFQLDLRVKYLGENTLEIPHPQWWSVVISTLSLGWWNVLWNSELYSVHYYYTYLILVFNQDPLPWCISN